MRPARLSLQQVQSSNETQNLKNTASAPFGADAFIIYTQKLFVNCS